MAANLPQDFCPYKGLQPYTEKDRAFFFGRDGDEQIIISNLYASHLTVLYGASGVGKSSVLLAGVVPQLREEPRLAVVVFRNWQDANFMAALKEEVLCAVRESLSRRKGAAQELSIDAALPLDEFLVQAVREVRGPIFFIFDQFEEYFLYHPPSDGAEGFEAEFARAINRRDVDVNFLISLREDGLSKLDRFQARIPTLLSNMLRLEHLDRHAAHDAITKPLEEYNREAANGQPVTIEPQLVEGLLDDLSAVRVTSEQVGQGAISSDGQSVAAASAAATSNIETPFLQMVLTRLWEEERGAGSRLLRLETFVKLGRAENIARTHLDKMMEKLSEQELATAASVLRYLVTPSGTKIAQEPAALVSWAELKEAEVQAILQRLGAPDMRILRTVQVPGQPVRYEIFHDVMAQAILDWRTRYVSEQKRAEAERQMELERAQAAEALTRAKLRAYRLRWIMIGLSVLLLGMVGLVVTLKRTKINSSRSLAEVASLEMDNDPQISMSVAAEAVRIEDTAEAVQVLKESLLKSHVRLVLSGHEGAVRGVAFSPDGKYLITAGWDKVARVRDTVKGEDVSLLKGHDRELTSCAFSPDGKFVVTTSLDGTARVWADWATKNPQVVAKIEGGAVAPQREAQMDAQQGEPPEEPPEQAQKKSAGIRSAAFSLPDGKYLVTGDSVGMVKVWEWQTPDQGRRPLKQSSKQSAGIFVVAFSPQGDYVALTGSAGVVRIWKWADEAQPSIELRGHAGPVYAATFSPDGKYLVTGGSNDYTARVWEWQNPQARNHPVVLGGPPTSMRGVAFDPKGKYVATASDDYVVRLWEWRAADKRGKPIELLGHTGIVFCVAFSRDGQFLATGSEDRSARIWQTEIDPADAQGTPDQLIERARQRGASWRGLRQREKIEKHLMEKLNSMNQ